MSFRVADGSGLLIGWVDGHGTRCHGFDLLIVGGFMVGNSALSVKGVCLIIVHHDFVVITARQDLVLCRNDFQTPDLALEVGLNKAGFCGAISGHHILEL